MDYVQAKKLVVERIQETLTRYDDIEPVVLDSETIERDWGWVIFYQDKRYLENGDVSLCLAGNSPYIVNRKTKGISAVGTAQPIEAYIREYERQLDGDKNT